MAEVRAFRAFRYDLGRVGALANVVAPPYDVIDPALQEALYERSPYNVIRLILNKESADDSESNNRYTRAARLLRDWQLENVLKQDSARSFYVYHQEFETEGRRFTRKGFLGRVKLEPYGQGKIYPHEETMAGPKADRLKLFNATAMNLSPIFGIYPDEKGTVQSSLDEAVRRSPPIETVDHLGVVSRLWPVADQHAVSTTVGLMGPKPVFIADGHHRYETGLRYLEERRQSGLVPDEHAANFILMMLVSMSDPGLIILPTHRLVSGLSGLTAERLSGLLAPHFDVEVVGKGDEAAKLAWEQIEAEGSQDLLGFGTAADGLWLTARFKNPTLMAGLARDHGPAWRGLAVAILHVVVLDGLLAKIEAQKPSCKFVHLLSEATSAVANRQCDLAALVPPAGMAHVEEIAGNLEKMPPKSTYFYPKLLSGLVFNSLTVG
jgi:uncharacterized protein (DUF1015 family)